MSGKWISIEKASCARAFAVSVASWVTAAKRVFLGESACVACERLVDADEQHRGHGCIKASDRSAYPRLSIRPARAAAASRCPRLRVDQLTSDPQLRGIPQLVCQAGAFLGHDELDDGGRIDVRVQRL
jgi:hypothetical protein